MSSAAILRLSARVQADYLNGGHVPLFVPDMNAAATIANYTAAQATAAAASAASAASMYVLSLALSIPAYGVGIDTMDLPRVSALGSLAFMDAPGALGVFANTQDATYQIRPDDFGKLLLTTSGARTYTLPLAADLPEGWFCRWRNRSGSNLTVNRSGADTLNAAATTIALATGTSGLIVRTSASTFEVF